jgi:hypothetical protein
MKNCSQMSASPPTSLLFQMSIVSSIFPYPCCAQNVFNTLYFPHLVWNWENVVCILLWNFRRLSYIYFVALIILVFKFIWSHVWVTIDGVRLVIGFIAHLQILATRNYNTLANQCTLLLTAAHIKSSQFVFTSCFLVMDVLCLHPYWLANVTTDFQAGDHLTPTSYSSDWLNSTEMHWLIAPTECPGYNNSARTT